MIRNYQITNNFGWTQFDENKIKKNYNKLMLNNKQILRFSVGQCATTPHNV